jgi:tetratricopeptide (TPR) repeat protein
MSHCSPRGIIFLLLLFLASCKTSESWLPRQWHNTIAHYNTYFNAREKLRATEKTSREGFTDRFDRVLEIYNYGDEASLRNNGGAMDEILKKTSNLVDRHPKSKWVDDAYMLMAESYFLRGDFQASRELYQYVFSRFQDPVVKAASQIGVFRCLYMSGKFGEAESLISQLRNDKNFPKELRYDLDEATAALYIRQEKYAASAEPLGRLVHATNNRTRKARLYFILGQVLQRSGKFNQAAEHYAHVVKLNPPYEMAFNAKINQVLALNSGTSGNLRQARSLLKQLLKDDKNFDYLDQIYFRLAETEVKDKNFPKAIEYYQLSLRNNKGNKVQMATSYLALADYFFDKQDFERSGYYYDSAVASIPKESPDYNRIAQKSMMLGELVRHLSTIREQDSLLQLSSNKQLLERTIDRLIAAEQARKQKEQQQPVVPAPQPPPGFQQDPGAGASVFPFYNATLRARGYNEFIRLWGQRDNRDYWRMKNMRVNQDPSLSNNQDPGTSSDSANAAFTENVPADRKKYYAAIPFSDKAKKDAGEKIAQAFFGAGNVYREKLQDCNQANKMYLNLLERFPKHSLEPQVLFNLVKCYRLTGNIQEAATYEAKLAADYPNSTYLNVLRQQTGKDSSSSVASSKTNSESAEVEQLYRSMYQQFKAGNYQKAMQEKMNADKRFSGNSLQAQFDYLFALCTGYSGQTDKAIVLMRAITSDYSGTPIAAQASEVVLAWEKKNGSDVTSPSSGESNNVFTWNPKDDLFFLVIFQRGTDANKVRAALADYNNRNHPLKKLEVGKPSISGDRYLINVTGFENKEALRSYLLQTSTQTEWKQNAGADGDYFCCLISQTNYLLLLKNGQTAAYQKLFEQSFK